MDIQTIRKIMDRSAEILRDQGFYRQADALEDAERAVEEEVGLYWTMGDNLATALNAIRIVATPPYGWQPMEKIREIAEAELAKWKEAQ